MKTNADKQLLRNVAIVKRREIDLAKRIIFSKQIVDNLNSLLEIQKATNILSYSVIGAEVDLTEFNNFILCSSGKKIFYPESLKDDCEIDVAIIPGLLFDLRGFRLGRGKGYYDKLLPKLSCISIGIGFDFQIVKKLPSDTHDFKMDCLVTNKRIIHF